VYTDRKPAKLQPIDPRKMKLKQINAAERIVGRHLAREIEAGDFGIDTMQAFLAVTLAGQEGGNLKDPAYLEQVMDQAGEFELEELVDLFEDEDDGNPPPDLAGPDPTLATPSGGDTSDDLPASESFEPMPPSNTSGV
jgi:hypothetical protein